MQTDRPTSRRRRRALAAAAIVMTIVGAGAFAATRSSPSTTVAASDTPTPGAVASAARTTADGTTLELTEESSGDDPCVRRVVQLVARNPAWSEPVRTTAVAVGRPGPFDTAVLTVVETAMATVALVASGDHVDVVRLVVDGQPPADAAGGDAVVALSVPRTGRPGVEWETGTAAQATRDRGDGGFVADACTELPSDADPSSGDGAAEVRAVFGYVYSSKPETGIDRSVASIEDGESIRHLLLEMRARYPEQSQHTRIEIAEVAFPRPGRATVDYELTTTGYRSGPRVGEAVLDDGRWKVSRRTWCDTIRDGGGVCPPSGDEAAE